MNKNILIIGLLVVIALVIGGSAYWEQRSSRPSFAIPSPTPSPDQKVTRFAPDPNSYLSPLKQEMLHRYQQAAPASAIATVDKLLAPHNLTAQQAEVVKFIFFLGQGFTLPEDEKTTRYYSAWHDYTITYPNDWELFTGDPSRIGILAPGTTWNEDEGYAIYDVEADVFFHAFCPESSFEFPFTWTNQESFTSRMLNDRRKFYNYAPVSPRKKTEMLGQPASLYTHTVKWTFTDSPSEVQTMLVNDYYFQIDDTNYLFDTRYPPQNEARYRDQLHQIIANFDPGTAPCTQYDQHFTKPTIVDVLGDLYDQVYGEDAE